MPKQKRKELKKEIEMLKEAIYHLVYPEEQPTRSILIGLQWQKMFEVRKKLMDAIEADGYKTVPHTPDISGGSQHVQQFAHTMEGFSQALTWLKENNLFEKAVCRERINLKKFIDVANSFYNQRMK